jgi:hypothetical protein
LIVAQMKHSAAATRRAAIKEALSLIRFLDKVVQRQSTMDQGK